jgi:hypothetical protein
MTKNITDLNQHLFDQMGRLSNGDLKGEELKQEIERSKAISSVAKDIIGSGRLALDAERHVSSEMRQKKLPALLAIGPGVPK